MSRRYHRAKLSGIEPTRISLVLEKKRKKSPHGAGYKSIFLEEKVEET